MNISKLSLMKDTQNIPLIQLLLSCMKMNGRKQISRQKNGKRGERESGKKNEKKTEREEK